MAEPQDPAPEPWPAGWDAVEEPARSAASRGRWLMVMAALPWLAVAALLLRGAPPPGAPVPDQTSSATEPAASAATEPAADPTPTASGGAAPPGPSGLPAGIDALRLGPRVAPGPGDAAAVATLTARAWLGDLGPALDAGVGRAGTGAYVEHLAVESVDVPAPGAAVVSLVAVLLEAEGDRYTRARPVRLAVPLRFDRDGARPAGSPWWLPAPDLAPEEPGWTPVDDPALLGEAGAALEAAGYRVSEVRRLERSQGWPLRAVAVAVAPGARRASEHAVWLREHLGELVVAGWRPGPPTGHGGAPGEDPGEVASPEPSP